MPTLIASRPESIVLIDETGISVNSWQLDAIRSLEGNMAGLDAAGSALSFPIALEQVSGEAAAWRSPEIQLPAAGKFIAKFSSSSGSIRRVVLDVSGSSSSNSGAVDPYVTISGLSPLVLYPGQLVRETEQTLRLILRDAEGNTAEPSSGTFSLYRPAGTAAIALRAVSVVNGVAQVTIQPEDLSSSESLGYRWLEVWVLDGETYTRDAAVCLTRLHLPETQKALLELEPVLRQALDLTGRGYTYHVEEAYSRLFTRLMSAAGEDRFPWLIVNPWALRESMIELMQALVFEGAGEEYERKAERHRLAFETAFGSIRLQFGQPGAAESSYSSSPAAPRSRVGRRTA